jgi:autotransporter passenger strand-loop-strand repeat protein
MASDYVIALGSVSGITLSSGDTMEVLNGGTAISTAILDSGLLTVSWG